MSEKVQLFLWRAIAVLYSMGIVFPTPIIDQIQGKHTGFPEMFIFYFVAGSELYEKIPYIFALIWDCTLASVGVMTMLLIMVLKGCRDTLPKRVFWTVIVFIVYCTVDIIGCACAVPARYLPMYSIVMDCFVIILSIWTSISLHKQISTTPTQEEDAHTK